MLNGSLIPKPALYNTVTYFIDGTYLKSLSQHVDKWIHPKHKMLITCGGGGGGGYQGPFLEASSRLQVSKQFMFPACTAGCSPTADGGKILL